MSYRDLNTQTKKNPRSACSELVKLGGSLNLSFLGIFTYLSTATRTAEAQPAKSALLRHQSSSHRGSYARLRWTAFWCLPLVITRRETVHYKWLGQILGEVGIRPTEDESSDLYAMLCKKIYSPSRLLQAW